MFKIAYKVKCQVTNEYGTSDIFIKIGGKYYKSQEIYDEHMKQLQCKDDIFNIVYEILGYDNRQVLPKEVKDKIDYFVGISSSKYLYYRYDIVLLTFKLYKNQIIQCINNKDFKNEKSKISYIFTIIKNNINDVYLRIQNANKAKEKTENVDTQNIEYSGAEYKTKTKEIKNKRINDLW